MLLDRDVQLVSSDSFCLVKDFDGCLVIFAGVPEHIGDHDRVFLLPEEGKFVLEECLRADVLQPDGIQHSRGSFEETRWNISGHGLA